MTQPWENEPNRVEFKYKGYDCLIYRMYPQGWDPKKPNDWMGHLCGYVAVPKGHPFYGETWEGEGDKKVHDLHVHGGITYAQSYLNPMKSRDEGNEDIWWLGFDCAHFGDLLPFTWQNRQPGGLFYEIAQAFPNIERMETYKTIEFVENEIKKLVDQLEEAKENA